MNAERLHVILKAVHIEITNLGLESLFQQLVGNLQNQVNEQQHPQYQEAVATALRNLYQALSDAESNNFSPAWKQVLEEVGILRLLGQELSSSIKNIFERNQITLSVALNEIQEISSEFGELTIAIGNLLKSFEYFKIGAEDLEAGKCELGILVPRKFVDNKLSGFAKELKELDSIFQVFAEVATSTRPGFNIRSISSSDLTVFLDMAPEIGACTAIAVERIVALYKKLLEIRRLRKELNNQDVPDKNLAGIEDHANTLMNDGIKKLTEELLTTYYKSEDKGRRNELTTALNLALTKIASRVDRGFNIEIRVEPLEVDGDEESDSTPEEETHISVIQSASKNLQFMRLEGDPILKLPESLDNDTDKDNKKS